MVIDINKTFLSPKGQKPIRQQSLLNKLRQLRWWVFLCAFFCFCPDPRILVQNKRLSFEGLGLQLLCTRHTNVEVKINKRIMEF